MDSMFSFYVKQQSINKINIMTNESVLYMEPKIMYVPNIYNGY